MDAIVSWIFIHEIRPLDALVSGADAASAPATLKLNKPYA